jgi:phosphomannomutase / phosphoglucomutase
MSITGSVTRPSSSTLPPPEIFKAYDIRGVVGRQLTTEVVEQIGHAIGSEARARAVQGGTSVAGDRMSGATGSQRFAVGRDGRLSGPDLVGALARGLNRAGCDVIDIGQVPTPVLYFATYHLGTGSGISVTGSHNPPEYNGLKIMIAGDTLAGDAIQALRQRLVRGDLTHGHGSVSRVDVAGAYIERILGDVKLGRKMRIAVDCGNGVAGAIAPDLLRRLGCEITELYCDVDGNFPNHHPDPSKPENVEELIQTVRKGGYDVGIAFDGDGDRLGVISPDGNIIWADRQMILFARDVLSRNPGGTIIYDVKCSRKLEAAISEASGKPLMWKTGHSLIKAKLRETGALMAGEMSGHIFFKERWYGFDDGLYSAARLLELLSRDKRSTAEIFGSLPNTVNTPELNIQFAEGEHHQVIKELVQAAKFPDAAVSTIDGVRVDFADGFGLVRASNTTPVLVLRFEGDTSEALERIQDRFRQLLLRVRPGLSLPF